MQIISKIISFNNSTLNLSYKTPDCLIVSTQSNKLILKLFFDKTINNSNFYYSASNVKSSLYTSLFNKLVIQFLSTYYNFYLNFGKLYMIGLGFKNFVLNNKLYILVGDCNYIIFSIPNSLKIFCRRNQVYVLSQNNNDLANFVSAIKVIKKANFYKGKGILEFRNFKFTKLKVGKKQRFM